MTTAISVANFEYLERSISKRGWRASRHAVDGALTRQETQCLESSFVIVFTEPVSPWRSKARAAGLALP